MDYHNINAKILDCSLSNPDSGSILMFLIFRNLVDSVLFQPLSNSEKPG